MFLIFFAKLILKALLIVWTTSKISQKNFSYKTKLCFYLCFINLNKTIHKLLSIVEYSQGDESAFCF